MDPVLRLTGITKRFGTLVANDAISLSLGGGEVLALLGENGAGKSTLVSILFGHYVADAGSVEVFGRPLPAGDPAAALAAGIGMVHQHFTLADNLTVLENVMLGTERLWRPRSAIAAARARLADTAARFGLAVDARARVGALSVGERQRVELLKALFRGARILILDEPTAVLTPQESERLFKTLKQFVTAGLAVIFISHKLDEVMTVADRVAVLRAGRLVAEAARTATNKAELAEWMVGRSIAAAPARSSREPGPFVLELSDVHVHGAEQGHAPLRGATLAVAGGEIAAIAGVAGNGQAMLADLLFGLVGCDAGTARLHGAPYPAAPRALADAGVARIPADRRSVGSVGDLSLWENAAIERVRTPAFARAGILRRPAMRAFGREIVQRFDVRGPGLPDGSGLDAPAARLSGGNLQKLILGRALSIGRRPGKPRLIVADQPTWGLDVGAVAAIHTRLIAARDAGDAVLVISEDLDEIFALADRIAVINRGRIIETRAAGAWTLADLGLAMAERRAA
jgi:general nucleoside transport system ATP-binding protein